MTLVILFSFAACKRKITCDVCGETKVTKVHKIEIEGEKGEVCDECYKELKAWGIVD
jgi:ribosome-binding protein aMBF1 (putative translation factor)